LKPILFAFLAILAIAAAPALAVVDLQRENVEFQPGKNSVSIKAKIRGDRTVDYRVRVTTGQNLLVTLKASNRMTYFNVLPPDDETALFVGSSSGDRYSGKLDRDGEYTVRVYLMRAAARRKESTSYTLTIALADVAADKSASSVALGPLKYDASGNVKCSAGTASLDRQCGFRVVRDRAVGSAEIWIVNPVSAKETRFRVLYYADRKFTSNDKSDLAWQRQDDNWWVSVNGKEFYLIPDALIFGG
jgi:hypothetical protein